MRVWDSRVRNNENDRNRRPHSQLFPPLPLDLIMRSSPGSSTTSRKLLRCERLSLMLWGASGNPILTRKLSNKIFALWTLITITNQQVCICCCRIINAVCSNSFFLDLSNCLKIFSLKFLQIFQSRYFV